MSYLLRRDIFSIFIISFVRKSKLSQSKLKLFSLAPDDELENADVNAKFGKYCWNLFSWKP